MNQLLFCMAFSSAYYYLTIDEINGRGEAIFYGWLGKSIAFSLECFAHTTEFYRS